MTERLDDLADEMIIAHQGPVHSKGRQAYDHIEEDAY